MNKLYLSYPDTKKYKEFKTCNKCHTTFKYTEFYMSLDKDGYHKLESSCRACHSIRSRRNKYRTMYGCTEEEVEELFEACLGKCQICQIALVRPTFNSPKEMTTMHIDHNHITGKARGILCHHCNVGLGSFKDKKDLLEQAIRYLDEA
jgi:hypothetical protein